MAWSPFRRKPTPGHTDAGPAAALVTVPPGADRALDAQGMGTTRPFSPGRPLTPFQDYREPPRQWDFRTGRNIAARPRSDEQVSFETMEQLIRSLDWAQLCVWHRIDDIVSLDWRVTPLDEEDKNVDSALEAATLAVAKPDGHTRFEPWLKKYLSDVIRYDCGTLYRMRNRGGKVSGLKVITGRSITPLTDYYGDIPEPDAPAYAQFMHGVPWKWLLDSELIYQPLWPVPESMYGQPPIERVILRANTDIRLQLAILQTWTDGNVPAGFMEAPADFDTPDKIQAWQDMSDRYIGDTARKSQVQWVPAGSKFTAYRPDHFDENLAKLLRLVVFSAYSCMSNDMGFTDDVNRSTSTAQIDVQFRTGTMPLVKHVESILDSYLQDDLGLPVKFELDTGQEKEDALTTAQVWQIGIQNMAVSADEMRQDVFSKKVDPDRPAPRYAFGTRTGPIPMAALLAVAGEVDPTTYGPSAEAVLPHTPFAPVEGVMPNPAPKEPALATQEFGVEGDGRDGTPDVVEAGRPQLGKATAGPTCAGLCVKADDTGRILLIQRAITDDDPAGGRWELPGGHIDPGEGPLEAALREWGEETGISLPAGKFDGSWTSSNGVYRCFIYVISAEAAIPLNPDTPAVLNPDNPDGDLFEVAAWWDPEHLPDMPALREEVRTSDWAAIRAAGGALRKELGRWRSNARSRARKGQAPRRFVSTIIPQDTADRVWAELVKASTVEEVDAAFAEGTSPKA